ncbi:peptidase M24 family protein [Enterocloster clostridioformis]|uniref:aminopeptidase P family protein n=1 Tax=Enterocloster clostridioformis TaxID=1531 RepID=UPI00080CAA14|nr:aminopeptidase P family protein [Enterocloster clostridioformis]ANU48206.1 peptidase M24 [Lachnoclostridium sp. YL32]NDO31720.1 aminopeptidase P family protein [Enterocloster clostridioformis]OXE69083.1 peptidase M24 family protein [Enterocloster clostridioformis]QQR02907.1 aminopeptidase P family protein [Enterocloster clostridioformis]
MNVIQSRLNALRKLMKERGMDAYMIPTADFHESEYVGEHFKCREYMTGFTGTAGTALVTMDEACLWVDGRYYVQAAAQLKDSTMTMMKMGQEGVPSLGAYLDDKMPEGGCLGFDGRVVNAAEGLALEELLKERGARISYGEDLTGMIWEERPELSAEPAWVLDERYAGKSALEKIADVKEAMKKAHASVHVLTSLDDIAWLLNIRGNDILYNPVVLSYALLTMDQLYLFVNSSVLVGKAYPYLEDAEDISVREYLERMGVTVMPYDGVYDMVEQLKGEKVLLEKCRVNYAVYRLIDGANKVIDRMNPTASMKAVKNDVEIENEKRAHIKDGVAMTKFIYWLKKNMGRIPMDEISVSDYLEKLRMDQEGCIGLSFATISAYGAHGAMCHYSATPESNISLEPRGLYLIDSGGQYYEGTTDITRTIAMGPVTDEEKEHFTLVLMSMLRLGDVKFLHGCRGLSLDYAAREPLWRRGLNYEHGTGHGVSYLSSVHERPNGIRFKMVPERQDNAVMEAGMITSDEPGVYIEGSHGIRTENLVLCVEDEKNEYGQFLRFEYLTNVPVDLEVIDRGIMSDRDVELLNRYHEQVYEKISPYLDEDERVWLAEVTRAV